MRYNAGMDSAVASVLWLISLVFFVLVLVDVWRSPASTGARAGWTVFAFFCTVIAAIVWFAWGRRRIYGSTTTY